MSATPSKSFDLVGVLCLLAALAGFAANSLLCRAALGTGSIDAASFTFARLASGALMLQVLLRLRPGRAPHGEPGSWRAGIALFAYAIAFSFAYLRLGAGTGALVLFGVVQTTMLLAAIRGGERQGLRQWTGLGLAMAGLVALTWPGLSAPDPFGTALMVVAGIAWGVYSLRGRGCPDPLAATAANFGRSVPFAAVVGLLAWPHVQTSPRGLLLAITSGAITSGLGYSLWYRALRHLTAARAALLQLAVPVGTALGSVLLLGEPLTARMVVAGSVILGGIGCAVARRTAAPRS